MFPIIPTDRAAAEWRNESTQKPPKQAVYVHESNAADILKTLTPKRQPFGRAIPQRQASVGSDEKARPQVV